MDSFFGIGAPELILILVIAGMVMGPERIVRTARWLGRTSTQLQNISRSFIRQLNAELDMDDESNELRGAWNDMQDMRRQIEELKGELMSVTKSALNEGTGALEETKQEIERTIAPQSILDKMSDNYSSKSNDGNSENGTTEKSSSTPAALPSRVEVSDDPE